MLLDNKVADILNNLKSIISDTNLFDVVVIGNIQPDKTAKTICFITVKTLRTPDTLVMVDTVKGVEYKLTVDLWVYKEWDTSTSYNYESNYMDILGITNQVLETILNNRTLNGTVKNTKATLTSLSSIEDVNILNIANRITLEIIFYL